LTFRLGIVDCDTSHVVAFTQRLHHVDVGEDHWVDGAQIVAAVPMPSRVSPERVPRFVEQLRAYGIRILDRPDQLLGEVDGVLVEANDGSVHLERALPFVEKGIPTWIDKPLACSTADALALTAAAKRGGTPLFSASSLRFDVPVQDVHARREELGAVTGADAFSPASQHPRNPGFFHYGVHAVEVAYSLLGRGCRRVRCIRTEGTDLALGEWVDGRLGTVRGIRSGARQTGFTAVTENQVIASRCGPYQYRELLKRMIEFFRTGLSPVPLEEMVEVVAFQEAANLSMERAGEPVELAEVGFRLDI
jgi:hypothetical protein